MARRDYKQYAIRLRRAAFRTAANIPNLFNAFKYDSSTTAVLTTLLTRITKLTCRKHSQYSGEFKIGYE